MRNSFTVDDLKEVIGLVAASTVEVGVHPLVDVITSLYEDGRLTDTELQHVRDVLSGSPSRISELVTDRVMPILDRPDPPAPSVEEIVDRATSHFREMLGQAVDALDIEQRQRPHGELPRRSSDSSSG